MKQTVVTHSGVFHADDVFAVAAFQLFLGKEQVEIIRTRDETVIAQGDYVVDVGGEYDHERKRYDHHQPGAPVRENGIPYAGFGLMWKHYGEAICNSTEVAAKIEEKLCQQVDAGDNGVKLQSGNQWGIALTELDDFVQMWRARHGSSENMDEQFLRVVDIAREYLTRSIQRIHQKIADRVYAAELYAAAADKRIVVSDQPLSKQFFIDTEAVALVFPDDDQSNTNWLAIMVPVSEHGYETKAQFPEEWAGLRDEGLQQVSGISDSVFCHKARFVFVAGSKESAVRAAQLAE